MALVALNSVHKTYPNGFNAVKDFNLEIKDGEFVVFVGPSGCGKSTTLRMVAGLEDVTSGTISIGDRVVNDVHPKDRDIAMVFQSYALYPHMSVYKNMAFALKLRKVPKAEIDRRVQGVAKTLGLTDMLDRKPRQLSGGQRQRVALGRAIVREPKAFLFDEPLSNLDAKLRVTTRAELKALHQRLKTTTIYVTHDQEEAMTLGDRIVVMSNGLIQQAGPPLDVYRNPKNRFVAAFVGTPPMNFLEGTLEKRGDAVVFVEGGAGSAGQSAQLPSHPARAGALAQHLGKPIVLGIRPQMFSLDGPGDAALRVRVNVVEPLGDTVDLSVSTHHSPHLVARIPARGNTVPAGQEITLNVAMDLVHYFEPGEFGAKLML